ncbi:MAG: multicopper oxidase domain-containing protein [Anaerolineae bacterium]|nr:multicopper oxidase domain-containing protein [Anaerolineae bacterium]
MNNKLISRRFSRRDFLKLGARGALLTALSGGALAALGRSNPSQAATGRPFAPVGAAFPPARPSALTSELRLAATDGYISLPGRRIFSTPAEVYDPEHPDFNQPNPVEREAARRAAIFSLPEGHAGLYVFGFVEVPISNPSPTPPPPGTTPTEFGDNINTFKGNVRWPSPIIGVDAGIDFYIALSNLGLVGRPDLDDSHTIHWHGFRNPNSIFDGVPEISIAVPPARDFPYYFRPHIPGTYMYHCHFEDSEHVQMGMDGIVFIRPAGNPNRAYPDGSTEFDRQYTLLFNEVDTTPHDNLIRVQEFVWSNYDPNYWVINGRSYPDTILSDSDIVGTELEFRQPVSSLIQANEGDRILLRMANLGYEQQTMHMLGIRMTVVGHDATFLGDLVYETDAIYIGPGEARDVIFEAPGYNGSLPGGTDDAGDYNVYWFKNHHPQRLVNGSGDEDNYYPPPYDLTPLAIDNNTPASLGGQITQVRVYPNGTLGTQTRPNQTFPAV